MGSSGFSSPRSGSFPAGLRVLVVDDDLTWLKILVRMLQKCNYQVTSCSLAQEAIDLLNERKDRFDIVISDVNMPDMDGFALLEHAGIGMDLPVIMMSVDGDTSRVMKGVQHGACDYLLKPIRMKELRNIWQHVFRKRMNEVRDVESQESVVGSEIQTLRNGTDQKCNNNDGCLFFSGKKRKDADNNNKINHDKESGGGGNISTAKKPRVVWNVELHQKFVKAVNQIGIDKVGPKKILDLMGEPGLTRENIASHLQKFRLYLNRLQKKAPPGIKRLDISSTAGDIWKAFAAQQDIVPNKNYVVPLMPMAAEIRKAALFGDAATDPPISPRIGFNQPFGPLDEFKEKLKPHFPPEQPFDHLLLPRLSTVEPNINLFCGIEKAIKVENKTALFASQILQQSQWATNSHAFQQMACSVPCANTQSMEQNVYDNLESSLKNLIVGYPPTQGDYYPLNNHDPVSFESHGYSNQEMLVGDAPQHSYDSVSFNPSDPVE